MASPVFILCNVLLLSGAFVESRPQYKSFEVLNNIGNFISEAVLNGKASITNGWDKVKHYATDGSSVSEDINNGLNTTNENAVNGLESVKNATINAIENLTPSQSESVAVAIKNILFEVGKDLIFGESLYKSMVQRTIEVTSKMESKLAQAIEAILLRVQKLQNGESFAAVVAEVSRTVHDRNQYDFD